MHQLVVWKRTRLRSRASAMHDIWKDKIKRLNTTHNKAINLKLEGEKLHVCSINAPHTTWRCVACTWRCVVCAKISDEHIASQTKSDPFSTQKQLGISNRNTYRLYNSTISPNKQEFGGLEHKPYTFTQNPKTSNWSKSVQIKYK